MTTIYLAARYSRYPAMQAYAATLRAEGHIVTSRWILGDHEVRANGAAETESWHAVWAQEDYDDLMAAEVCISFTEGPENALGRARGGRHVEFGMALAMGKRCIVMHFRENVFHWLPHVEFFPTWDACLAALGVAHDAGSYLPHPNQPRYTAEEIRTMVEDVETLLEVRAEREWNL